MKGDERVHPGWVRAKPVDRVTRVGPPLGNPDSQVIAGGGESSTDNETREAGDQSWESKPCWLP